MEAVVPGGGNLEPWFAHNLFRTGGAELGKDVFQNVGPWMARIDKEFWNPLVRIVEQQQTARRLAVAAGPADFLIIGFDGIRNVGMNDEPHLAAIDSHA